MSEEITQEQTSEEVVTPPEGEKPAASAEVAPAAEVAKAADAVATPPVPAWSPDWKYKFKDQEFEVDEWLRSAVSDKEKEQYIKEVLQKAKAHEVYKPKLADYETVASTVADLKQLFEQGKFERVLESLGFTDDMIYNVAREKLERSKLSPAEQQKFKQQQELELANEELLKQNENYRSEASKGLAARTDYEIDTEVNKPEVKSLVEALEKSGGPGSFKRLVIERGAYMVERAGKHVHPSEVIASLMREYKPMLDLLSQSSTQALQPAIKPKVVPQVGRSSNAVSGQTISSIEDLKKKYKQLTESGD